jgi:predicted dehydrogenase
MAPPRTVIAQVHAFTSRRIDPESGVLRSVGTPDSVQVLATLADGARALYHISGVTPFGQGAGIWLYGTEGVLHYDLNADRIQGANRGSPSLSEIPIPATKARGWRVEAEFIDAIRGVGPVSFTTFQAGVEYMEFTEAVARSAQEQTAVDVPFGESEAPRT